MKKQPLLFLLGLLMALPILVIGQNEAGDTFKSESNSGIYGPKKGEFHLGVQDIRLNIYGGGRTYFNFSPRIGYMISDKDLIFADAYFSNLFVSDSYTSFEIGINYRRYLGKHALMPFVQTGIGYGKYSYSSTSHYQGVEDNYIHANLGAGVSYRYKKWSIETGLELEYNQTFSDMVILKPMVGASFSF